jgi:exopolyphosphatase/guanosine-5'-triphosphate,3'-diphosphate pyrophosphatase
VATEACRRAENADDFFQLVHQETGLALQPISAANEALLTLSGCSPLLDAQRPYSLLFDIGGGSTEIVWARCTANRIPEPLGLLSLPLGVVGFSERFGGDRVSDDDIEDMAKAVDDGLAEFNRAHKISRHVRRDEVQMVGTSGTVTTVAAVLLRLRRYRRSRIDGLDLYVRDVLRVSRRLLASDWRTRAAMPCIGRERADLVVSGCAILGAILKRWPVARLRVADRGIREGLLLALAAEQDAQRADEPA